ncbi:hypothetical protein G167_gp53 [Burkholderia phage BcepMigl]|uniref:Uncharacterized protein n=1 Tax=Burkholderia phage BcepMigl TaxID=2886899 RepID=I6XGD4_9CAUD|nr:hypothetical protein G167_gp53 [Burkholderia phage BcepMigl]AFN39101.1 hypothetical protein BcepMigl_gp32 [Burkholderia phage BcepMigl]
MELKDEFGGDNALLVTCIKALLDLDAAGVLVPHGVGGHARVMLAAAGARIAALEAKVEKLETENAGLALDKLTAPPAPASMRITPSPYVPAGSGPSWQDYDVQNIAGELPHFSMIRVVRRVSGADRDHPAFALIERRLLAGNPVEV